jgi:hypothetical protein
MLHTRIRAKEYRHSMKKASLPISNPSLFGFFPLMQRELATLAIAHHSHANSEKRLQSTVLNPCRSMERCSHSAMNRIDCSLNYIGHSLYFYCNCELPTAAIWTDTRQKREGANLVFWSFSCRKRPLDNVKRRLSCYLHTDMVTSWKSTAEFYETISNGASDL